MKIKESKTEFIFFCICILLAAYSFWMIYLKGPLRWSLGQKNTYVMLMELFFYAAVLSAAGRFMKKRGRTVAVTAALLIFSYSHYMLLPMAAGCLYSLQIYLAGHVICARIWRKSSLKIGGLQKWMLGVCCNISIFAVMSLAGCGNIRYLIMITCIFGTLLFSTCIKHVGRQAVCCIAALDQHYNKFCIVLIFILIPVGRAVIALDYDSVWYGLRAPYVLDNMNGVYENLNLPGCVYTYPKGFEILALPVSGSVSYGFLYGFNIVITILILYAGYKLCRMQLAEGAAWNCVILLSSIPGIMNMSTTAKPDSITLLIQLICLHAGALFVKSKKMEHFIMAAAAYLLSLAFKPTAVIFSTFSFLPILAVYFGLWRRGQNLRADKKVFCMPVFSAAAVFFVWLRMYLLTGFPAVSLWTKFFRILGFSEKYPYMPDGGTRSSNFSGIQELFCMDVIKRTVFRIIGFFAAPVSEDTDHIIIAWGTVLCTVLMIGAFLLLASNFKENIKRIMQDNQMLFFTAVYMIQLGGVFAALWTGSKPDGNYFMLFYALTVIVLPAYMEKKDFRKASAGMKKMCGAFVLYNILLTCTTNWAWACGMTERNWNNPGFFNHKEDFRHQMQEQGMDEIYERISSSSRNRVVLFAEFPYYLRFPCITDAYLDISFWGNEKLTSSVDAFAEYLEYTDCDYVFIQKDYIGKESYEYELVEGLFDGGHVSGVLCENGNILLDFRRTQAADRNSLKQYFEDSYGERQDRGL